jgi:FMN phosphatase YigB (HAD superfamily)
MEVKPDEAVMVGDTLTADILGAQNTGMYGIWITRRAHRPENLNLKVSITPDAVIGTLDELPAAIQTLS